MLCRGWYENNQSSPYCRDWLTEGGKNEEYVKLSGGRGGGGGGLCPTLCGVTYRRLTSSRLLMEVVFEEFQNKKRKERKTLFFKCLSPLNMKIFYSNVLLNVSVVWLLIPVNVK